MIDLASHRRSSSTGEVDVAQGDEYGRDGEQRAEEGGDIINVDEKVYDPVHVFGDIRDQKPRQQRQKF